MRLLKYGENEDLSIAEFDEDTKPPYAILSHRWGAEVDEVTFEDVAGNTGKNKPGYAKIRLCGEQAHRDGLQYFWVDTCCIDKSDKAELSLAIQSMFRWYQNSTKCYVYLFDVSTKKRKAGSMSTEFTWEPAFRSSQWFARGWTLQELLAPSKVEFYSLEWEKLGDKMLLKSLIHKITSISCKALDGVPLSQFSINERLRWIEHRHTTRPEDKAYSLLGVVDVDLAPCYGEGVDGAFKRLHDEINKTKQCIQDLCGTDPRNDKKRIEDTRGGLLKESYRWVLHNDSFRQWQEEPQSQLLWIKGDPGKGKTMLLCGIIDELQASSAIAKTNAVSYFFCQATDARINSATAVLRGLLYMLVNQQPSLAPHVRKKYDHAGKTMFEDANAWFALVDIFTDVLRAPGLTTTYLIIDALDECVTDLPNLLNFVAKQSSASSRIKWIVSSRNWPEIAGRLQQAGHKVRLSLELNAASVSTAVQAYIEQRASDLAQQNMYDDRTKRAVLKHLTSNAHDTFLWVALVCQHLQATARRNVLRKLELFPPRLDALYERMMQQISKTDDAGLCKQVLAVVALVYRPITLEELVTLVEPLESVADDSELQEIIGLCGSFLTLREQTVYFVHQSAKDFLLAKAAQDVFPAGQEAVHRAIFARSLQIMSTTLRRDMYGLKAIGTPIDDVEMPEPDPLAALRYSCVHWVDHLCDSTSPSYTEETFGPLVKDSIISFVRHKCLYWLEALGLCKAVPKGVASMTRLEAVIKNIVGTSEFQQLVQDACRFIMYHKGAIESAPLQAYVSALIFSPTGSLIRNLFRHEAPKDIVVQRGMTDNWSNCLQTLENHSDGVYSVTFSPDATQLAAASADKTVKIWDAGNGACLKTLKSHSERVFSVAFSPDATQLASASADKTAKIWDASSGACLYTLEGHSDSVHSVGYSHDSTCLASASSDGIVKIWSADDKACLHTLNGHSVYVMSVAFSHDSTRLASASFDETVRIWHVGSGMCLQILKSHSGVFYSVVFSHDSTRLATASHKIVIWDASSGECLQILEGHSDILTSITFSYDSTRLASSSFDSTVKIWNIGRNPCLDMSDSHSNNVEFVAFSHDSILLASASRDKTVKIWDTSNGACLHTLVGHSDCVTSVAFSCDSAWLASVSYDGTARIWDVNGGACLRTFKDHDHNLHSVAFSYDSTRLASSSSDIVKIWNTGNGTCLHTLKGHENAVLSIVYSRDSSRLASGSTDGTIKIWNANSGACIHTLKGHNDWVRSVAFSYDSTILASASDDRTVRIWDASSNTCLWTLEVNIRFQRISFDNDNSRLRTDAGTIRIGASSAVPTVCSIRQIPQYSGLGLSPDATWITCNSDNLLWLPSDYRPGCLDVSGNLVGIGNATGRVRIFKFSSDSSTKV